MPARELDVQDDAVSTQAGEEVRVDVLDNDNVTDPFPGGLRVAVLAAADGLTVSSDPAHGTVSVEGDGITYTPAAGFSGEDAFSYTLAGTDPGTGDALSGTAEVTITVEKPEPKPVSSPSRRPASDSSSDSDADSGGSGYGSSGGATGGGGGSVYYRNCDAAKAAGAAPIRRGEPGYAKRLDRDGDGVACDS
ncbi:excalibur calcium-binding domain-containing protein [Streptomyces sp. NPDC019645]|uniref:excalibur calcium-binding domain-containing protein n=1 Tax=Streptomyces sp. NPDC019645 TaxID=3154786 RepID=UPI003411325B